MKAYEYIIKIRDRASKTLRSIAQRAGTTQNKIRGLVTRMHSASTEGNRMGNIFSKLGKVLATVFIVGSLSGFLSNVISIRAEFEKYEAVLTNTFQSAEAGQTAMNMIKDFAAKTPFQLNQLTGAYVKLVNRGFIPTEKNMISLGDLAASQGKSFDQLTEAILDAETAEFERLKEFGIKASKAGNKVTFAFKGVKKTVDANAKSIRKAILGFGDMEGVTGSMAAISKTLGGRLSNLKDKWDNLLNSIGKGVDVLQRNLQNITVWFGYLWSSITQILNPFQRLIKDFFGITSSADIVTNSLSWLNGAFTSIAWVIDLVSTGISTVINWFLDFPKPIKQIVYGLIAFKTAMWLVNLAMHANPVSLVIAGIVLLIGMIGLVTKYTTGWGKSWNALKTIFRNAWGQMKADFNIGVDAIGHGFTVVYLRAKDTVERIIGTFKNMKAALELALSGEFTQAWKKANERVFTNASKQLTAENTQWNNKLDSYIEESKKRGKGTKEALGSFGVDADYKKMAKDFKALKSKFSNATSKKETTGNYRKDVVDKYGRNTVNSSGNGKETNTNGITGITGGGKKQTHITINLEKLQDKTEIHTISLEEGIEESEDKLIEMLLRVLNSSNQIQTSLG